MASEGTDSSWSRQGAVRAPATATRRETTREAEKRVPAVSSRPVVSLAPACWATRTMPPVVRPVPRDVIRKHTVEALLIAANPVSPTILPTTKRSTS